MAKIHHQLGAQCLAEAVGTFMLVFFGVGAVHAAVISGAQSGLWQVAIVWGVCIMLAIYAVGGISGAHINPAITLAFAVWGRFPWSRVGPYLVAQLFGAMLAASVLFVLWQPWIAEREQIKGVTRGQPGSEITAMCYGEYFPNPGGLAGGDGKLDIEQLTAQRGRVPESLACFAEFLGTFILALVVFALTDDRNHGAPPSGLAPVFIGLTIAALISVLAPLTQAGFNPARDFGPRVVAYCCGWKSIAIPGPSPTGFFTVYILSPIAGAIAGGGFFQKLIAPALVVRKTE